jgi:hypothetical protein
MIPKIIHFIWMQGLDAMPANYRRCVDSWARLNPGWQVKVWSRANLPKLDNAWALDLPTATFQCDVIRFEIVHQFGGIYFDADHECRLPLDGLVDGKRGFVSRRNSRVIENSGFGAVSHAEWLREVMDLLRENRQLLRHSFDTDFYWWRVVASHPELHVFPWWTFQSTGKGQDEWKPHGDVHALHHRFALWTQEKPEYADAYGRGV